MRSVTRHGLLTSLMSLNARNLARTSSMMALHGSLTQTRCTQSSAAGPRLPLPPNFRTLDPQMAMPGSDKLKNIIEQKSLTNEQIMYSQAVAMYASYFAAPLKGDPPSDGTSNIHVEFCMRSVTSNPDLLQDCHADFLSPSTDIQKRVDALEKGSIDHAVFCSVVDFNRCVLGHNLHKTDKSAVVFRLNAKCVTQMGFPHVPHGIFLVIGPSFFGFHVRFHDIARGGIRLIPYNATTTDDRLCTVFKENYDLAYTQTLKNKDIPESGSKGIIYALCPPDSERHEEIYLRYIDAMLDMIIPGVPGVKRVSGTAETLFFGPDENTSGTLPTKAAMLGQDRGYEDWKTLTTGKGKVYGGIAHDEFGMTTESVREFAAGVYRKTARRESDLSKIITGGPDGDLGGNEIRRGLETIKGVCDATAVVYDPKGVDRTELVQLAVAHLPLKEFRAELSPRGFMVLVSDERGKLPDGTTGTGREFLKRFHLSRYAAADVFVPCGGLPDSITLDTVNQLLVGTKKKVSGKDMFLGKVKVRPRQLKFKYIVEGANLFISNDARVALERCGVVLIRDSSANKGGVTCSSIEVFSGLALSDEEHAQHMCKVGDGKMPLFYSLLVKEIMARIRENARREFEVMWRAREAGFERGLLSKISRWLSKQMIDVYEATKARELHKDESLFIDQIQRYTPKVLLELVPQDLLFQRVPQSYLRAIFDKRVASEFVYTYGHRAKLGKEYDQYLKKMKSECRVFVY